MASASTERPGERAEDTTDEREPYLTKTRGTERNDEDGEPKMIARRLHGVLGYDAFKYQLCLRSPLREIEMDTHEKLKIIGVSSEWRTQSPIVRSNHSCSSSNRCVLISKFNGNTFNLPYFNMSVYINKSFVKTKAHQSFNKLKHCLTF